VKKIRSGGLGVKRRRPHCGEQDWRKMLPEEKTKPFGAQVIPALR
jgi:hypothetical protein